MEDKRSEDLAITRVVIRFVSTVHVCALLRFLSLTK